MSQLSINTLKLFGSFLAVMMLFGCGGSSSNSGVFVDSPVEGLNYKTDTISGITGPNGEFQFKSGETVTFSIGDVVIGSAVGDSVITPLHMGTVFSTTDPVTINISRLLQSLDADGNLDNGIQITPEVRAEMSGRSISFNKPTADFEDDNVKALFNVLNAKKLFNYSGIGRLRTELEAQTHLRQTLVSVGFHRITPVFNRLTTIRLLRNFSSVIRPSGYPHITSAHITLPVRFQRITTVRINQQVIFPRHTTIHMTLPIVHPPIRTLRITAIAPTAKP